MQNRIAEYLLGLMEPAPRAEMDEALRRDPKLRRQTELMRQALAPLEEDPEEEDVPPGLYAATLGKVAQHICSDLELPHAPTTIADRTPGERRWYQRIDVIVAASLALFAIGLASPFLLRSQAAARLAECQANLRQLSGALSTYRDQHGHYPSVAERPPHVAAGMVAPLLREAGVLTTETSLRCPNAAGRGEQVEVVGAEQVRAMTPEEFDVHAARLSPFYAYSLGFRDEKGRLLPPGETAEVPQSLTALMSDAPPAFGVIGNSRNHEGKGQNVLFADGHVSFATIRTVGYRGDDIFLNIERKVAAGLGAQDAVLGWSGAQP